MTDTLLANAPLIRIGIFLSVLTLMALWEVAAARRPQQIGRLARWPAGPIICSLLFWTHWRSAWCFLSRRLALP